MSSKRTSSSKNTAKAETAAPRMATYFVPGAGIDREVISADICRYLGNDALVRPGVYTDRNTGQESQGFFVTAYRALTTNQLATLKADSARWLAERTAKTAALQTNRGPPAEGYVTSQTARQRDYMAETGIPAQSDRDYVDQRYTYAAPTTAQSPPQGYGYEPVQRYVNQPPAQVPQGYGSQGYTPNYQYAAEPTVNYEAMNRPSAAQPPPRTSFPSTMNEYAPERQPQPTYGTGTSTAYYQPPTPVDRSIPGTSQPDYGPPPVQPQLQVNYSYTTGRDAPVYDHQDDDMDYDEPDTVPIPAAAPAAARRTDRDRDREREREREPERGERERRRHKERR